MSFYGWKIVAALFVMLAFSSGLGFYNHAIIVQALAGESGFSIETASMAVSIFFMVSGLAGLVIAPILEKHDVRWVILVGAVLSALSLWALGRVTSTFELFFVYGVFGIGYSATSLLPSTTLVARWFETNRARALAVASTGLSVGGMILTPVSAALVERYGLSASASWLGLLYLVGVLPISLFFLRSFPAEMGLQPDGQIGAYSSAADGIEFDTALRQHFFWGLSFIYVLIMVAQVGGIAHQYGLLAERLTPSQASFGVAILPAFSVAGRLIGGAILDSISTLRFTLVMIVIQGFSLIMLGNAESVILVYTSLAFFGASVGNLLMLQPLILAEVYGLKHYTRLYSWSNLIMVCGVSAGPSVMGWLFGYSGSYHLAYGVAGTVGLAGAALLLVISPPAQSS